MATDNIVNCRIQGGQIERTREPNGNRDIVDSRCRVESVEEPHALLRQRQRNLRRTHLRSQRRTRTATNTRTESGSKPFNGRRLEQLPHRHRSIQRLTQPRRHLRRNQRITTEREEIIIQTNTLNAQNIRKRLRHNLFHHRRRSPEHRNLQRRNRQRPTIQLPVHRQRNRIQHHKRRRHHVLRQQRTHRHPKIVDRNAHTRSRNHIRHQPLITRRILTNNHRRLRHRHIRQHRRLDLTDLDPEPTDLHLIIRATQILQITSTVPRRHVTRAVQHLTSSKRTRHKPRRRQPRLTQITPSQLHTRDIHLTRNTNRHRSQTRIEHKHLQTRNSLTHNTRRRIRRQRSIQHTMAHMHRRLRDAVHVHQRRRRVTAAAIPVRQATQLERLPTENNPPQRQLGSQTGFRRQPISLGQLIERRRRLIEHRHPLSSKQLQELLRRPRRHIIHNHQRAAVQQRTPQLPHREVERITVEHRPHIRLAEPVHTLGIRKQLRHRDVRNLHTLRATRRTRRVNHIRNIRRPQRRHTISIRNHRTIELRHIHRVDINHRQTSGQHQLTPGPRNRSHRSSISQHELDTISRIRRIHRQIPRTGLHHRQQRHHKIRRPRQRHRHQRLRTTTLSNQPARQTIRPNRQLRIRQRLATEPHRDPITKPRSSIIEPRRQRRLHTTVDTRVTPRQNTIQLT
ncbi:hypothetical protein B0E55_02916 [Rhodococcus sp. 66b]|nr:hypothetical protein B0E55_02916 [Rhodococcus sp. 66b]